MKGSVLNRRVKRLTWASLFWISLFTGNICLAAQLADDPEQSVGVNPSLLQSVHLDQRLGERIPLDVKFRDEHGETVDLRRFFDHGPVILTLVYYQCPMLCTEVLNGLVKTLRQLPLKMGSDFSVVTVSIDPSEYPTLAGAKHAMYAGMYGRPEAYTGWHFLTGDQPQIKQLADSVGFQYAYDPVSHQFAHPSAVMVLTPDGQLAQYYYGVEYSPRDLRLGLTEASQSKIGSRVDQLLLYCYHYDPHTGRYGLLISRVIELGAGITLLGLASLITVLFRRESYGLRTAVRR